MFDDTVPEGADVARLGGKVGSEIGGLDTRPTVRMYGGSTAASAVAIALVGLFP